MTTSDVERIIAFEHRFARAQATGAVDLPWGFGLIRTDFPSSHQHNRVVVTSPASVADILTSTDDLLGSAALRHRYICVDDDALGAALASEFTAAGFEHETNAYMVYAGPEPQPPRHAVAAVSLDTLRPALVRDWRVDLPDSADDVHRQLADRTALYAQAADTTLLATFEGDEIAAHATLFIDPIERIAQFENLVTGQDFRSRGHAGALVHDALGRARRAACELAFLTADVNDWPRQWYARLGFIEVGRTHGFTRLR